MAPTPRTAGENIVGDMALAQGCPEVLERAAILASKDWVLKDGGLDSDEFMQAYRDAHPQQTSWDAGHELAFWTETYAPENIRAAYAALRRRLLEGGGSIRCWRAVRVEGDPVDALRQRLAAGQGLGVYWTMVEERAHAHDGPREGKTYVLEGLVTAGSVDWVETLAAAAHPDWQGEEEVRVRRQGGLVTLVGMRRRDGWLDRVSGERWDMDLGDLVGAALPAAAGKAPEDTAPGPSTR